MIVVGGEALVDLVIDPDGSVTAKLGGGPFNAARAIGRLGSEVAFLGALSRDRFGTLLHQQLLADNVRDSLVQFTELPTTLASAELDSHGAASYHFYLAETAAPNLHPLPLPEDLTILHVGTLGMVLQPMASTLEAVVDGLNDDVLVVLDPNCRPRVTWDRVGYMARLQRMLRRADVVKVSSDDLDFVSSHDHAAGVRMLLEGGAGVVLHTDGGRSVHIHSSKSHVEVPVPVVEVVDTIGAGDAFGGAFAAWWDQAGLGRDDLRDSDALGAAVVASVEVAAVSCTRVGAQPPRRDELGRKWSPARS
jgi:fructokinase